MANQEIDLSLIEKHFRLNWSGPKEHIKPILVKQLRTTISAPRLIDIIGKERADYLFKKMLKMKEQKRTFKVQNKGVLTVYCK